MRPPCTSLPTCTMNAPPSSIGEIAVPQNSFEVSIEVE